MIALPPRSTNCCSLVTMPGMRLELLRERRRAHKRAGGEDVAASLERIVSTRDLQHLLHRRPGGDVNVLTGFMKCLTRQRHPVLPAHEATDSHGPVGRRNVDGPHAIPVSRAPHEALGVRGNELAVVIEERAVGAEREQRIEERAACRSMLDALDDADDERDAVTRRDSAKRTSRLAIDDDALFAIRRKTAFTGGWSQSPASRQTSSHAG